MSASARGRTAGMPSLACFLQLDALSLPQHAEVFDTTASTIPVPAVSTFSMAMWLPAGQQALTSWVSQAR